MQGCIFYIQPKLMKQLSIISLFSFITICSCYAQEELFVVTDKDGDVNVREHPNVDSKILGILMSNDLVAVKGCNTDHLAVETTKNWQAIVVNSDKPQIGYIYKDRLKDLFDLPRLEYKITNNEEITYADDRFSITITIKPVKECDYLRISPEHSFDDYIVYDFIEGDSSIVGLPIYDSSYYISNIELAYNNEELDFPKSVYHTDFFPSENPLTEINSNGNYFTVLRGYNNRYYVLYSMGDGGEFYNQLFTIDDTGLIDHFIFDCDRPIIDLK